MLNRLSLPGLMTAIGGARTGRGTTDTREVDVGLLLVGVALLAYGLVMVYSASVALPDSPRFANFRSTHYLTRHLFALVLGGIAGLLVFSVPMKKWQDWAPLVFVLGLVMLVAVLIPGLGKVVYGARRWLPLGPLNLQPSEVMKLFAVLYAADYTVRKQDWMHRFSKGFAPMAGAMCLVGMLLLLEPDLGAFVVIVTIAMGVLFLGGVNLRLAMGILLMLAVTFCILIWTSEYRRARIFAYLDPFDPANALGRGYQLSHSLIAFGRGELFGVGLGGSVEKLHYLPEAHTDFLLAVIGEELGLAGVLVAIGLFFWFTRRAFEIGRQAIALERSFAGLVAQGIAIWIGAQSFFNMGVNLGLLPTKGLTLPFMSYGGSGILVNIIALALLLRVDHENRRLMRGARL
ncbi:MAG: putative lipid II flippase FtsW [Betaproteobacteria bacterium]|jgi:cell division protein FtsW|nr:putative lipid II flippase FtsW [Betaproteobacteria bacterium]NBY16516.1 putative lipid II flippase FtsW [Betaproteobacteria bacterium]